MDWVSTSYKSHCDFCLRSLWYLRSRSVSFWDLDMTLNILIKWFTKKRSSEDYSFIHVIFNWLSLDVSSCRHDPKYSRFHHLWCGSVIFFFCSMLEFVELIVGFNRSRFATWLMIHINSSVFLCEVHKVSINCTIWFQIIMFTLKSSISVQCFS